MIKVDRGAHPLVDMFLRIASTLTTQVLRIDLSTSHEIDRDLGTDLVMDDWTHETRHDRVIVVPRPVVMILATQGSEGLPHEKEPLEGIHKVIGIKTVMSLEANVVTMFIHRKVHEEAETQ